MERAGGHKLFDEEQCATHRHTSFARASSKNKKKWVYDWSIIVFFISHNRLSKFRFGVLKLCNDDKSCASGRFARKIESSSSHVGEAFSSAKASP